MSDYYNPRKTYGLYIPGSPAPFKISRTKIDLFFKCPKCFYLDRVCGVAQPPGYPFSLNAAVDRLLKKEFDLHADVADCQTWMRPRQTHFSAAPRMWYTGAALARHGQSHARKPTTPHCRPGPIAPAASAAFQRQ